MKCLVEGRYHPICEVAVTVVTVIFAKKTTLKINYIHIYIIVYSSIVQVGEYLTVTTVTIVTT